VRSSVEYLPAILAVVVATSLVAVVLTRLWVKQLSLRLEERLELDTRLVPIRNALTTLRDAVSLAHSVASELDTLRQLREEASTIVSELRAVREEFAKAYNSKLDDVDTHRETLAELIASVQETHKRLDDTYLAALVRHVAYGLIVRQTGERLVDYLEASGYRVNTKLKSLITDYFGDNLEKVSDGWHTLRGGVDEHAKGP